MDGLKYFFYYTFGKLRRLYFMQFPENDSQYKKSRGLFIVDGVTANVIGQLIGGAFLAFLLKTCGVSDALNGIITALATIACTMQFVGLEISKRLKKHKLFVCVGAIVHRLLFTSLYFIPFLNISGGIKVTLFTSFYLLAHGIGQIIGPPASNWLYSLIPNNIRGQYLGLRDIFIVGVIMITNLICGQIIDYYKGISNESFGFMIVGIIVFIATIVNFISLSAMKEPRTSVIREDKKELHGSIVKKQASLEANPKKESFISTLKNYITLKSTRRVIIINILWNCGYWISLPYLGIYQISELALSYVFIMGIGLIANIVRIIVTPFLGKMADKKSFQVSLMVAFSFMASAYLLNSLCVPQNGRIIFILFSVIGAVGWAGIPVGILGLQMTCMSSTDRTSLAGVVNACGGICAFLSALIGGGIMKFFANNTFLGFQLYPQQILSFLSGVIFLVAVIILNKNKNL